MWEIVQPGFCSENIITCSDCCMELNIFIAKAENNWHNGCDQFLVFWLCNMMSDRTPL